MSSEPLEPYYTSVSCLTLQIISILLYCDPQYIHLYFSLLFTWGLLIWNNWCVSKMRSPMHDIDPCVPISLTTLLCLYYLHAWLSPLAVLWTYLLLAMPALSFYLMSTMTTNMSMYKDMYSLSMLFSMAVAVLVVSASPNQ